MAKSGSFDIKFTADSSDLRAELEKVSKTLDNVADSTSGATNDLKAGLDTAKKSAEGLAKKVPSVGAAAKPVNDKLKQTGESAHRAAGGLSEFEQSAGTAGAVASGLSGALGLVSPKAAKMTQAVSDSVGGLEAVARSGKRVFAVLGPVAVAVSAVGAAYSHFKGQLDDANAALETQRTKLAAVQDMHRKVKEAVLLADLAQKRITQTEFDAITAAQSAADLTRERREALMGEKSALDQKRAALEAAAESEVRAVKVSQEALGLSRGMDRRMASAALGTRKTTKATTENAAELHKLTQAQELNAQKLTILDATEKKYAKALEESKKGIQTKSAASTEAADLEREQAAERLAAIEALDAIFEEQTAKRLSDYELLEQSAARELEIIQEKTNAHLESSDVLVASWQAEKAVHDNLAKSMYDLDMQYEKKSDAARKAYHQKEKARKQRMVELTMSANTDLAGSTADLFGAMSAATSEHDKKTALTLFRVWKGLSLAHIGLKTAEGYMTAAALPPPVDVIKGAAVTAAAAASSILVSMQKPPFHTGSGMVRAPDGTNELNARLRDGEAVATPLGAEMLGRDNIEAANAGISSGSSSAPVVFQYEHRTFTRFIRDNIRGVTGGLDEAITAGRTIGQRGV